LSRQTGFSKFCIAPWGQVRGGLRIWTWTCFLNRFCHAQEPDTKQTFLELAEFFTAKYAAKYRRPVESISPEALRRLLDCDWPGNVRELENCIERAVLVARGKSIAVADLPDTVRAASSALDTHVSTGESAPATAATDTVALTDAPLSVQLRDFEKRLLEHTLEKTQGNYAAAARQLGVSPRMMYYRARGVGIGRTPSAT
jgi:Nif-specific regulatory protein